MSDIQFHANKNLKTFPMKKHLVAISRSNAQKLFLTIILFLFLHSVDLNSQVIDPTFPVISTHGYVEAITADEDYYYIGGFFDIVGPPSFNFQILNKSDLSISDGWPEINSKIHSAISDENGGFYICTSTNVIHLKADKTSETILNEYVSAIHRTVNHLYLGNSELKRIIRSTNEIDATFDPIAVTGNIAAISENDDYLFIGGDFTLINDPTIKNLVRISKATFVVDESWVLNPVSGYIRKMLLIDRYLYLGGSFSIIDGENQAGIARIDLVSYELDDLWSPTLDLGDGVKTMVNDAGYLYLGGNFIVSPGQTNICRINLESGAIDASFDVSFSVVPEALFLLDNSLFVGASSDPMMLYYLNKVNLETFTKEPFYLPDNGTYTISESSDLIFFGGDFNTFDGIIVDDLCKINAEDYSIVEDFTTVSMYHINALESFGPYLYVGDNTNLKTLVKETGLLSDHLALDLNGYIFDMEIVNDYLYIAGDFDMCNGSPCNSIIRFDIINETIDLDWSPVFLADHGSHSTNGRVNEISYHNNYLYVTGFYSQINDIYYNRFSTLARININSGLPDPSWMPEQFTNGLGVFADNSGIYATYPLRKHNFSGSTQWNVNESVAFCKANNFIYTSAFDKISANTGEVISTFFDATGFPKELFYDNLRNKLIVGGDIPKSVIMFNNLELNEISWTGAVNDNWFNTSNWDASRIPNETETVIINPSDHNPTIETDAFDIITIQNLVLNNNTSLTIEKNVGLNVSGSITNSLPEELIINGSLLNSTDNIFGTINRQITGAEQFHLIGTPVFIINWGNPFTIPQLDQIWMREYNEALGNWESVYSQDNAVMGKGYSLWLDETLPTVTANFAGNLNVSDINPTLTNSGTTGIPQYDGWNLLSNPFAAALSWDHADWNRSDLDGSVYTWDASAGNYVSWNGVAGSLTDGILPVAQGFFVKASGPAPSLTIPASARLHNAQPFYKNTHSSVLSLKVVSNENHFADAAHIMFSPAATAGFDNHYDAYKLYGESYAPQLYTQVGEIKYSINALPSVTETPFVDLGFETGHDGAFSITATNITDFQSAQAVYLEDNQLNTRQNLKEYPVYTFHATENDPANRFKIAFEFTSTDEQLPIAPPNVWHAADVLHMTNPNGLIGSLMVFDVSGKPIAQFHLNGSYLQRNPLALAQGIYITRFVFENSAINSKIVVSN